MFATVIRSAGSSGALKLVAVVVVASCARAQAPPGGPQDLSGPQVTGTFPEPFAQVEAFDDAIRISFNERISERGASGTLNQAVLISPESGEIQVRHKKDRLEIKMDGGFLPDLVYRVTVLPSVQDLFRNRMPQPFEFVFSTGAEILPNVIAGMVFDRLTGEVVEGARVTARHQPLVVGGLGEAQGPTHVALTDTSGVFALRYLPPVGRYVLTAFDDRNRNREADFSEPTGAAFQALGGADTVFVDMSLLQPDTTAAFLSDATVVDSVTVAVEFDDYLDPGVPLDGVTALLMRDSVPDISQVREILHERDFQVRTEASEDSLWVADSVRIEASVRLADSLLAAGDSAAAEEEIDTRPTQEPRPDTNRREDPARDLPKRTIYLLLSDTLVFEEAYEVSVSGVLNINGIAEGGGTEAFLRAAPPVDSVAIADSIMAADSVAAADSAGVDTGAAGAAATDAVVPDTAGVPSARPDTVQPDTLSPSPGDAGHVGTSLLQDSGDRYARVVGRALLGTSIPTRRRGWSRPEGSPWR